MTVLHPVSTTDKEILEGHVSCLEKFGPYPDDSLLAVVTPDAADDNEIMVLVSRMARLFGNANDAIEITPRSPQPGWPLGPNEHFSMAISIREKKGYKEPFLWMESDAHGARPKWLGRLKYDYSGSNTPYFGVKVSPSLLGWEEPRREDKSKMIEYWEPATCLWHMSGVAIYPGDYVTRSRSLPQAKADPTMEAPRVDWNRLWAFPNDKIPFDIFCAIYHRPMTDTKLIKHLWSTHNYRISEEGVLICDDAKGPLKGRIKISDREFKDHVITHAGPIDLGPAVLIHGCKDNTLAELIMRDELPELEGASLLASTGPSMSELEKQNAELQKRIADLEARTSGTPKGLIHRQGKAGVGKRIPVGAPGYQSPGGD